MQATAMLEHDEDQAFEKFVARANRVIKAASGIGLGLEDFQDAQWRSLWEDLGDDATDHDIRALLAEADPLFCDLAKLTGALPVDHQPGDF
jgi:hypothetical protein